MFDRKKALERAQAKRHNQQEALQATLNEIEYIEKIRPNATALIKTLKIKRDRQELALRATDEVIEIYSEDTPQKKAR